MRRADYLCIAVVILAGIMASAVILLKSFSDPHGYLSPDSTRYLALAANLLAGRGFVLANDGTELADYYYCAVWPAGYPGLIAAIAGLSNLSPFLASKLLNCALLMLCMMLILRAFGRDRWALSLTLLFGASIELFSYTWSEAPFVPCLILLSIATGRVLKGEGCQILPLVLAGFGAFLARYIGAFSISIIALLAAWHYHMGRRRQALATGLAGIGLGALIALYLGFNLVMTGYATGQPRPPAVDDSLTLAMQLMQASVRELVFPLAYFEPARLLHIALLTIEVGLGIAVAIILARPRAPQDRDSAPPKRLADALAFTLVGLAYLASCLLLRWRSEFDPFDFRLLHPGFLLLFIGAFALLMERGRKTRTAVSTYIVIMAVLALSLHLKDAAAQRGQPGYRATVAAISARYSSVPSGSVVIFQDDQANYLRPDLQNAHPRAKPDFPADEPWPHFIGRLDRRRAVFIDGPSEDERERFDIPDTIRPNDLRLRKFEWADLLVRPAER